MSGVTNLPDFEHSTASCPLPSRLLVVLRRYCVYARQPRRTAVSQPLGQPAAGPSTMPAASEMLCRALLALSGLQASCSAWAGGQPGPWRELGYAGRLPPQTAQHPRAVHSKGPGVTRAVPQPPPAAAATAAAAATYWYHSLCCSSASRPKQGCSHFYLIQYDSLQSVISPYSRAPTHPPTHRRRPSPPEHGARCHRCRSRWERRLPAFWWTPRTAPTGWW